jgi:adenosylcobinamide-GDP ribazoletransferase
MKKQIQLFLTALMFFTRLPVPKNINHNQNMLQQSARYFTWIGLLVGCITAMAYYVFSLLLSAHLAIAFSMITGILTTGAFHEDGFADCCDAFGGGWTKEKILQIMKDSRLGTFGVTGLIGILALKYLLLVEIYPQIHSKYFLLLFPCAHAASRFMAVVIMQTSSYVQDTDTSKSKPLANRKLTVIEMAIAIIGVLIPFYFLPYSWMMALLPMLWVTWRANKYFKKWIGGYTGDCLGATQQATEVVFYIAILIILTQLR